MINLTICVPTRNRQRYCMETLRALAGCEGADFEVVVADNSDDGAVLDNFFENTLADARFRRLAPENSVLSMVDNWERTIAETRGRWICFIGDDDYLDPRLSQVLQYYEKLHPDVDVVGWNRMHFNWPDNRPMQTLASVPVTSGTLVVDKADLHDRLFRWSEGLRRPSVSFGVYHGAVRRSVLERIKARFGGRYFEHPNVDYDSACKVILEANKIVHSNRALSVLGACAASNSAGVQSQSVMSQRLRTFNAESRHNIPVEHPDFPFPLDASNASLSVTIAHTIVWFCTTYNVDMTGFAENFARAAANECLYSRSEEQYAAQVATFRRGFAQWHDGRYAEYFRPAPYIADKVINKASGLHQGTVYFNERKLAAETPAAFYHFGEHAMLPLRDVLSGARAFVR
ncbi:glycosyltransferase family 2 protein [Pseudohoeflea coraliihabitans]|uniref:Glycosyltransferase family 2 protein n=1 Tax=Pseudohoeflea coraliihabitans TaxID=2860393 RepID=A0ABS6WMW7_9HYPH|nr:glycosyltransferase family A protein [Pseudohoeflea sp. DP4N28-3]MBW3097298.1 glycosyltransferase family 2 protein [Pseudohoeflea sp. DP4N28-3]